MEKTDSSPHGFFIGLLDMPFVQAGQAHGDALAAEAHGALDFRFAAHMESLRTGDGIEKGGNDLGIDTGANEDLRTIYLLL